jgi:hypothetical protein
VKFVVYFALASAVPTFAVAVLGIRANSVLIVVAAGLVMLATNVAVVLVVKRRSDRGEERSTIATSADQGFNLMAMLMAGTGVALGAVGGYLNLVNSNQGSSGGILLGFAGVVLVLASVVYARRRARKR